MNEKLVDGIWVDEKEKEEERMKRLMDLYEVANYIESQLDTELEERRRMRVNGRHLCGSLKTLSPPTEDEIPEWLKPYGMNAMWLYIGMRWGMADVIYMLRDDAVKLAYYESKKEKEGEDE